MTLDLTLSLALIEPLSSISMLPRLNIEKIIYKFIQGA